MARPLPADHADSKNAKKLKTPQIKKPKLAQSEQETQCDQENPVA